MTDEEVYHNINEILWEQDVEDEWCDYVKTISTNDLIQYIKYEKIVFDNDGYKGMIYDNVKELKTRTDIPEELKLEVLLLIGDKM